jgi:hypothetical protein
MGLAVVVAEGSMVAVASRYSADNDNSILVGPVLPALRIRGQHGQEVGFASDYHQRLQPYQETLHFYC